MPDLNRGFLSLPAETTLAFEQKKWLKVSAMFSMFVCLLFQGKDLELFDVMCVSIYMRLRVFEFHYSLGLTEKAVHASKFRGSKVVLISRQRVSTGSVPWTRTEPLWIQWFLQPMSHRGCVSMETTLVFQHKMKVSAVISPMTSYCRDSASVLFVFVCFVISW